MTIEANDEFQLVFEGPEDDQPGTLRKLKGCLIGDLELSVAEVQEALQSPPRALRSSPTEKPLRSLLRKLKEAGGKAMILPPIGGTPATEEPSISIIEFDPAELQAQDEGAGAEAPEAGDAEMEFSFDPTELAESASESTREKSAIPTYELNLDEATDSDALAFDEIEVATPKAQVRSHAAESPKPPETGPAAPSTPSPGEEPSIDSQLDSLLDLTIADEPAPVVPEHELGRSKGDTTDDFIDTSTLKFEELGEPPEEETPPAAPATSAPKQPSKTAAPLVEPGGLEFDASDEPPSAPAETGPATPPAPTASAAPAAPAPTSTEAPKAASEASIGIDEESAPESAPTQAQAKSAKPEAGSGATRLGDRIKNRKTAEAAPAAEELSDSEAEDEKREAAPKKSPFGRHDIAVPVLLGAVLLGVINFFVFGGGGSEDDIDLKLKQALEEKMAAKKPKPRAAEEAKPTATAIPRAFITLLGTAQAGDIKAEAKLMANQTSVLSGSITITTPQPHELTPEEIVQKKVRPPWVTHIDIDATQIEARPDSEIRWEGPAKVYIEYLDKRDRLLSGAVLKGRFLPSESRFELNISVRRPADAQPRGEPFFVEFDQESGYRFAVDMDLTGVETARTADEPAQAAAPEAQPQPAVEQAAAAEPTTTE